MLKELERFRLWQRLQRMDSVPPPRAGQLRNTGSVQRSSPVLLQEVVEDLEEEEMPRGSFSPLWVLLLWVLSCAGIGFGVRWLIWPEELSLPQSAAHRAEEGIPAQVDLAQLPLIPVEPVEGQVGEEFYFGGLDPGRLSLGLAATPDWKDLQVDPLQDVPNLLDSLQTDLALASEESAPPRSQTVEQLAASLERPSQPSPPTSVGSLNVVPLSENNIDSLGPNRGEGTFLVLTTYSGAESLARARQVSHGAFVKDVDGQKFVQLAAFEQLEYARYHAETLKSKGFNVTIAEQ
ncbi:hypothetical protein NW813_03605 [Synechococcus sp. R55.6]|uniref:hypothetical protein n=1 Tax=unclassified Synechococcus TaxID=2626047 RepID=UPI0039C1C406